MSELKKMTVEALRDLARKALGRGHSKLKTKDELVAALQAAEKKVSGAADRAAAKVKQATGRAAGAADRAAAKMKEATGRAARAAESVKDATGRAARAAEKMVATAKGKRTAARASRAAERGAKKGEAAAAARRGKPAAKAAPARTPPPAGPDPEGHFVARVAGESAAREAPHPMLESAAGRPAPPAKKGLRLEHAFDEQLGELPWSYGDDAFVALPRDPKTLFLYWDHAEPTLRSAWEGLEGGRPQLWVFAQRLDGGWDRIRTVEFALESRSYYIHDLDPGRVYRAEIHLVDRAGRDRLLGQPSNDMGLPPVGASPVIDDRFMRIPWGEPLARLLRHVTEGGAFPDELRAQFARLSDWGRFGSAGGGSAGGIGGVGGKPTSAAPSSPTSPFGPSGRGEGR